MKELVKLFSGQWARRVISASGVCVVMIYLTCDSVDPPVSLTVTMAILLALFLLNIGLALKDNGLKSYFNHEKTSSKVDLIISCLLVAAFLAICLGSKELGKIVGQIVRVGLVIGLVVAAILPHGDKD